MAQVICGWCKRIQYQGGSPVNSASAGPTHGICSRCLERQILKELNLDPTTVRREDIPRDALEDIKFAVKNDMAKKIEWQGVDGGDGGVDETQDPILMELRAEARAESGEGGEGARY